MISRMALPDSVVDVWVEFVQFSEQTGVGLATAPGDGTSPALTDTDRQRASGEIAASLFMEFTPI